MGIIDGDDKLKTYQINFHKNNGDIIRTIVLAASSIADAARYAAEYVCTETDKITIGKIDVELHHV